MSLKSRLKIMENKTGSGRPELCFFNTFTERREGGSDFTDSFAVVVGSPMFASLSFYSQDGETLQAFEIRACEEVFEKTGVRPVNEAEILADNNGREG